MATRTNQKNADPYASLSLTVERERKGRKADKRNARFATLDTLLQGKQRPLTVKTGENTSTVDVWVVGPATFGEAETFTGIPALIGQYAKEKGIALRTYKVKGNVYGVARKS